MHPEIKQEGPGTCPKCGGMDLVKMSKVESLHAHHDHASMMATPDAAADFLKRFYIVSALLVPLAYFSMPAVMYLGAPDFALRPYVEFGFASAIFYFGVVFFEHARHEIMARQYGMMTLVSIGVGAGYVFSAASTFIPSLGVEFYLEIATLIWILLFGHFLEAKSSTAAGDALTEVAKLLPKQAHLKTKQGFKDIDIESVKENDIVLVKPGEKVPADGIIVKGSARFNESHISGESKPVEKKVDFQVVAGAISLDGSVEVRLVRVGKSSTIGQIHALISTARKTKPSVQRLADRAAKWLTVTALSVSLLTFVLWAFILNQPFVFAATLAITVLVIACPHALGLAIPTVTTIATKLAVSNGVFIKNMAKIEVVKRADYVVFDKTGTLTKGSFGVTDIVSTQVQRDILKIAASIETHSSHVIAMAITKYAKKKSVPIDEAQNAKNLDGRGMQAIIAGREYYLGNKLLMVEKKIWSQHAEKILEQFSKEGKTPVFVGDKKSVLGGIALSDEVKDESKQAIAELHALGVKVAMLTGDTQAVAQQVAQVLKIDTVFAEVLPEDKYKHIKELQRRGNVVIMAGDGINDAPALTQANVGVAIGAGTDVAVEAGDIILTQSNPQHLVRLIILSKKVYAKMIQNLWWALGYNIFAIPAAAGFFIPFGLTLSPAVGALFMSLSSVIVVINAMSLRKARLVVTHKL